MKTKRRKNIRLPRYNYGKCGFYFVTICTKDKRCYLGDVRDNKINLSEIGKIVQLCWQKIPEHFSSIGLGKFIVMPNHIHGIIEITNVGNADLRSLQISTDRTKMLLFKTIHGFKSSVTRLVNKKYNLKTSFAWQKSYYDHIIRNEKSLYNISSYIMNNHLKWQNDIENPFALKSLSKNYKKQYYEKLFK